MLAAAGILQGSVMAQRAALPVSRHQPVVIAHRGDHINLPENTLAAYESAIRLGADYVEVDLRTTSDSCLVVSHNASVDAQTNGKGLIREMSFASVQQLLIPAKTGHAMQHIPTFKEVLATCHGRVNIYLDFKEASVAATWKMICEAGMQKHIVVYANTQAQLKEWLQLAPGVPLIASLPGEIKTAEALGHFLEQYPVSAIDGDIGQYNDAMLQTLHEHGVVVWYDVQSEKESPETWAKALELHAAGMQTDHPAALINYLHQKHTR